MSIKSLIAKAALFLSAPLLIAPAAIAQDNAWGDFNPAAVNPNIVPHPYFYQQGPQAPSMQAPNMQYGMPAGMGGQQRRSYNRPQNLPPTWLAPMGRAVNITSDGNENAPYFQGVPSYTGGGASAPVDRPISNEDDLNSGRFEGGQVQT